MSVFGMTFLYKYQLINNYAYAQAVPGPVASEMWMTNWSLANLGALSFSSTTRMDTCDGAAVSQMHIAEQASSTP